MVNDILVLVEVEGVLVLEVEGVLGAEEAVPCVLPFESNTNLQHQTYVSIMPLKIDNLHLTHPFQHFSLDV